MAADPVVLRILRPYGSAEEYLAAEAWSLDARSMLLIDEAPLPADTPVVFEVTLKDGSRPIKAEARVSGPVEAKDGRPGGLRVRFRRYGASTKAFIERAMSVAAGGSVEAAAAPAANPAEPSGPGTSSPEASAPLNVAPEALVRVELAPEPPVAAPPPAPEVPGPRATPSEYPNAAAALAALRARAAAAPEPPSNREYLLEKLRQRNAQEDVTVRFQRD
jgi:hypothetical protein